LYQFNSVLDIR